LVDGAPEADHLAVELHVHFVEVAPPMPEAAHTADPLPTDAAGVSHHIRTVSWQMSMPRSNSRSSTLRELSGKRTYISTTRRITSGDELKRRNGLGGSALDFRLILAGYRLPRWSDSALPA